MSVLSNLKMAGVGVFGMVFASGVLALSGGSALALSLSPAVVQSAQIAAEREASAALHTVSNRKRRHRSRRHRISSAESDPRFIDDFNNVNVRFRTSRRRFRSCPGVSGGMHFQDRPCWAQFAFDGDGRR